MLNLMAHSLLRHSRKNTIYKDNFHVETFNVYIILIYSLCKMEAVDIDGDEIPQLVGLYR